MKSFTAQAFSVMLIVSVPALQGGCVTTREPTLRTVEVQVPIHAPCTAPPPTEPDYADTDEKLRNAPDHIERVKLLLIGRLQRIAHDQELHAYAQACAG